MLTEIQILKRKDKKIKKSLITILIELILIKKVSMITLPNENLVK